MTPRCECESQSVLSHQPKLIVLTGGPGAGKTAVVELARRRFCDHVVVVPEAASIIFSGGFWRNPAPIYRNAAQRAIYHVQRELERAVIEEGKAAVAICDRGTIDSEAYWGGDIREFWADVRSNREQELARYASVIHLRTPDANNGYTNKTNPVRIETAREAARLDELILRAWKDHPHRTVIPSTHDFIQKTHLALEAISLEIPECCRGAPHVQPESGHT